MLGHARARLRLRRHWAREGWPGLGFTPFRAGDIVVFKVADRDIPIVHRVIKVHEKESGEVDVLTKGDNNAVDDRGLYAGATSPAQPRPGALITSHTVGPAQRAKVGSTRST